MVCFIQASQLSVMLLSDTTVCRECLSSLHFRVSFQPQPLPVTLACGDGGLPPQLSLDLRPAMGAQAPERVPRFL